ncbi:MAG: bi-domain-containing oxidoreductase [Candidatus Zixiibacteriota bacterium]
MKQLLQHPRERTPQAVTLPDPVPQPGCVLIRTRASLISSGTERASVQMARASLMEKARRRPDLVRQVLHKARTEGLVPTWQKARHRLDQPLVPGYSCAGTVVGLGEGVSGFRIGDRVAAAGQNLASHAELTNVPVNLVCRLPESVGFDEGAFVAVGAIALHGVRTGSPLIGETVAVVGLGLLGQLTARILSAQGCRVIGIDPSDSRRRAAESNVHLMTAAPENAIHVVQQATGGLGADAVIVCAASRSENILAEAAALARDRACITVVGAVPVVAPREVFYRKELQLRVSRSYGPGRYDAAYEQRGVDYPESYVRWTENRNMQAFLQLIADKRVDTSSLITHRFKIEESDSAYGTIESEEQALAVVFEYPPESEPLPVVKRLASGKRGEGRDIIGVGFWGAGAFAGSVLAPLLASRSDVRLVGVASRTPVAADQAMRQHRFAYATCTPERLLEDHDINLLVIATPHHLHAAQAMAALKAGKSVFLEKPMATEPGDLRELAAMMAECGPRLQVGFNRRFSPAATSLDAAFADVRDPKTLVYRVAAGPAPESGWMSDPASGGRIKGEICHFIDTAQYLIGSWPCAVRAEQLGKRDSDGVLITLRFTDGSTATIIYVTDHNRRTPKESLEIFGGGVSAAIDDYRRWIVHKGGRTIERKTRQDKGHRAQFDALIARLRTEDAVDGDPLAAICATDVTFAVHESLRTGATVEVSPWL